MVKHQEMDNYIEPLCMNGLRGRMLRMPKKESGQREILLLYGHHSSLERMFGFAEILNRFGAVTMPDLPGFGGMESFYKIGRKPSYEAYADYLAAFMKLRYKRRRVTIVAMSFSVPIVIRTLQKYPELEKRVDVVVSTVGFAHKEDFVFDRWQRFGLHTLSKVGSVSIVAGFLSKFILRGPVIKGSYYLVLDRHSKLKDAGRKEQKKRINYEVKLWKMNDVRTRLFTIGEMLRVNVCDSRRLKVKMWHVAPDKDRYFDNEVVKQHMQIIFENFEAVSTSMPAHAPSIIATAKDAAPYVPKKVQHMMQQKPE